jgi:hypothetical protein
VTLTAVLSLDGSHPDVVPEFGELTLACSRTHANILGIRLINIAGISEKAPRTNASSSASNETRRTGRNGDGFLVEAMADGAGRAGMHRSDKPWALH